MSSTPAITALYTVTSSSTEDSSSASTATLNFEAPIVLPEQSSNDKQVDKENYLNALAASIATLQESINTGLTQRLVELGILSNSTDTDPNVKNKLRTKVPGQPNNSKKAQAKKQQQVQKQKQKEQQKGQEEEISRKETEPSSAATLESQSSNSTSEQQQQDDIEMQEEMQYRPKGGIYGDDEDEDSTEKDEVDLVMEADPGEIDGACLELPKDQQQQESQTKKRNELPSDVDMTSSKKPKGSE